MRRDRCHWIGRGRFRPVRCNLAARVLVFGPRGAAVRCSMHAASAVDILARHGTKHATCPFPKLTKGKS